MNCCEFLVSFIPSIFSWVDGPTTAEDEIANGVDNSASGAGNLFFMEHYDIYWTRANRKDHMTADHERLCELWIISLINRRVTSLNQMLR